MVPDSIFSNLADAHKPLPPPPTPPSSATLFCHPTRYEDRLKMPYTEAFMNEVFRFGSITPLAVHATPEETTLGGYRIPKRTWVIGNLYGIHWDKKVRKGGYQERREQ